MRLSISLNGATTLTASLSGEGYLSSHLTLANRPKENDYSKGIQAVAIETKETETIYMKWPIVDLQIGDVVEVQILADGQGDAPSQRKTSSEAPSNLFSSAGLAQELIQAVSEFEKRLTRLRAKAAQVETVEDCKKIERACATVAFELGEHLLYPIYRRHKELIPEDLKGELL